ncbi:MAG TPA: prepilin peptidase [bacterium]|nr:prepilin peptidase [bacterium]
MVEAVAFIIGLVFGSFANVLIHRLPRHESIVFPGSRCPSCGTAIRAWDNIPVVSFLVLRGRCRECGSAISPRYVVVELATGALMAGVAWRFGPSLAALRYGVLAFALLVVFFTDLEHQIIPNAVTYPGIVVGLALSAAAGDLRPSLIAGAAAGLVFLILGVVSRGGMGGGDIKLAAMIGAFLGTPAVIVALFLAVALGGGVGLVLLALRLRSRKDMIPFGPAMAAGALIAVFGSNAIINWYVMTMFR